MIHMTSYYTNSGRLGLKASPLCLGTMAFGNSRWGSEDTEAYYIFECLWRMAGTS